MAGQRAANKARVTVPIEKELLARIEDYARKNGMNRVHAMKLMLDAYLKRNASRSTKSTK